MKDRPFLKTATISLAPYAGTLGLHRLSGRAMKFEIQPLREKNMPFVNIRVTGGVEAPTREQKEILIKGVTELLAKVLNKNPATTFVIIDEVPMENWGVGGESISVRRMKAAKKEE